MCKNYKILKAMKRFTILVIIAFCVLPHIMSQKISPIITMQDGREVNSEYAFLDGDTCSFRTEHANEKYNWAFALFEREPDALIQVLRTNERTSTFTLHPNLIDWHYAKRYEVGGDSSVYFKGMVYLLDGQEKKDSLAICFNLLPSTPKIIDASFIYTKYDWEYNDFFPNAEFSIYFRSERCDKCLLYTGDPFYFDFPLTHSYFRSVRDISPYRSSGILIIRTDDADWGQFYEMLPGNKYGWGTSNDTLFSTNYIHDPIILARLEELKKEWSSVSSVPNEYGIRIIYKNSHIEIEGNKSLVQGLSIYNPTGKLMKTQRGNENTDISNLPQGVYIVSCRTTTNQLLTKKIMKQ